MTTYLGKSCSFCLPRVPFVNRRQFMYLVIPLLVLRAGYGIWLYQFLIIAYLFTLHIDTMDLSSIPSRREICVWLIMKSVPWSLWPNVWGSSHLNLSIFKSFRTRLYFSLWLSIILLTISTRNQIASVFSFSYVVAGTLPSREIERMYIRFSLAASSKSRQGLVEGECTAPQSSLHCARFFEDFPPNLPIHFSTAFLMNVASGLSHFVGLMVLRWFFG